MLGILVRASQRDVADGRSQRDVDRQVRDESTIGGYRVPQGSWLYVFPYVTHRDARWFAAPASFAPDRFAPEKLGPLQKSAYMPLGLGPHVCIGKALSTIVLTSMLARIVQDYRLELATNPTDMEPEVGIVIRPNKGVRLTVMRDTIG